MRVLARAPTPSRSGPCWPAPAAPTRWQLKQESAPVDDFLAEHHHLFGIQIQKKLLEPRLFKSLCLMPSGEVVESRRPRRARLRPRQGRAVRLRVLEQNRGEAEHRKTGRGHEQDCAFHGFCSSRR